VPVADIGPTKQKARRVAVWLKFSGRESSSLAFPVPTEQTAEFGGSNVAHQK
jgi:hypothetical protein